LHLLDDATNVSLDQVAHSSSNFEILAFMVDVLNALLVDLELRMLLTSAA
jgi:hypothetical protein